ncbi:DUF2284 domain-containing protein [Ihubacter massiliensis]|uniref:DUF2284 domain-containing protein n=1 Tax=Hominibacterium faecale TaxID=2839743 RepID=A0A9J6QW40_9FIRM|nr:MULTISPECIES: DUF2284 domain-containing protein [Eubacteriales Family XIII. Incertae Sedis]MCO7123800.1 DUF2284 domain-containing protein [Ihubacter massiliensis]MCU7378726.1 DUF2284 domain-containing protein [Hominibacterium faecale]
MKKYFDLLSRLGMDEAKVIDARTVKTAAWTRYRCQYGCDCYGTNLCCPPYTPDYDRTQKMLDAFNKGILFTSRCGDIKQAAVALSRELFLDGYYKTIAFGSGPCMLCSTCSLNRCRFPKKTIPSMEGCGIDVFATVRANGYEIDVVTEKGADGRYFGLVLFE